MTSLMYYSLFVSTVKAKYIFVNSIVHNCDSHPFYPQDACCFNLIHEIQIWIAFPEAFSIINLIISALLEMGQFHFPSLITGYCTGYSESVQFWDAFFLVCFMGNLPSYVISFDYTNGTFLSEKISASITGLLTVVKLCPHILFPHLQIWWKLNCILEWKSWRTHGRFLVIRIFLLMLTLLLTVGFHLIVDIAY